MAKQGASALNITLNSVSIEDEINNSTLNVTQEVPQVRGFSQLGPDRVTDGYDWNVSASGAWDGAASQGDATIFALLSAASVTVNWDPTGNAAGASDPNYDGSVHLGSYSISAATGSATTYNVTLQGDGALTRAVS